MNPAISRSLPTSLQPLDKGPQKRTGGEPLSSAFEEALSETPNTKGDSEKKSSEEATDWKPIRWTLAEGLGARKEPSGDEEPPNEGSEPTLLPEALFSRQGPSVSNDMSGETGFVDGDERTADTARELLSDEDGRAVDSGGKPEAAPLVSEDAPVAPQMASAQPLVQANERTRERMVPARPSDKAEQSLPGLAKASEKTALSVGDKPSTPAAIEQATKQLGKPDAALRGLGGNEGPGRENGHQQQQEIRVVSIQRAPAPAPTVGGDPNPLTSRAGTSEAAQLQASQQGEAGKMVQTLKIQLQPAELGTVTAKLRLVGEQLMVDLQVESTEARHRLSTDSESIVKALRSLGYDIDRVTVQQSAPGGQSNTATGGNTRDGAFQSMSDSRGEGDPSRGAGGDRSTREEARNGGRQAQDTADASHNGLYI
ncbi:flagellar hook-length control protein FliK [Nitratireductor kimnyeongensis]|uniref:Flagellar hook-length control protein FliK n=1 Tax=Nitratireductor kimnyeongensis TaxID=430679 RepID=A0ABW0T7C8_9HYPH|nr:flagellar hook-length control protein FliK [Nitratireductor kimnyeongensis]QZZ36243.1 flagellar hook-length control protein FliK [Nitratireductor kimnyeongensis]